jgi:hypothetical protein
MLGYKDEQDESPLGKNPLKALLTFSPILVPPLGENGHMIINLCDGDDLIGTGHLGWKDTFEYADPRAGGQFLYADGYFDDINLNVEIDDSKLRDIVIDNMRRCRIEVELGVTSYEDAIDFIVATMRS